MREGAREGGRKEMSQLKAVCDVPGSTTPVDTGMNLNLSAMTRLMNTDSGGPHGPPSQGHHYFFSSVVLARCPPCLEALCWTPAPGTKFP